MCVRKIGNIWAEIPGPQAMRATHVLTMLNFLRLPKASALAATALLFRHAE